MQNSVILIHPKCSQYPRYNRNEKGLFSTKKLVKVGNFTLNEGLVSFRGVNSQQDFQESGISREQNALSYQPIPWECFLNRYGL